MKYIKNKNEIIVLDLNNFNINQTLNCGQIFRYTINGDTAVVYSKDKKAEVKTYSDKIVIQTNDVNYFEIFFDLKTDYSIIKKKLKTDTLLLSAVDYGYGIRILNNDAFEMIVSFIISANNNISRIKNSIEYICTHFGLNMGEYYAFPTLKELKKATVQDFKNAGLGYRAEQLYQTLQILTVEKIEELKNQSRNKQFETLISLKGIGEKVANCIMLFGLGVKDVFPVDTWINKVYNNLNNTIEKDRKKITRELTARYGALSGYAQQYFFYYFRDNNLK